MKKKLLIVAVMLTMLLALTACSEESKYIGKWNITKINAGDGFEMNLDDLAEYGIDNAGYIRLNKSGSAVINLLGDEFEGKWKYNEKDKNVTITYGKDQTGTATRKDKTMTFIDSTQTQYELKK